MNVGERLKDIRVKCDFTQRDLAEKAHVAVGTIQQYELEKRQPRVDILVRIAAALNVSIYCFLQQAEEQRPLTLEELESRVDPVWVTLGEALGYWCLCSHGAIMPPSGLGFMAKDRPDWVFYGCEIIASIENRARSQAPSEGKSKGERIKEIRGTRNLTQKKLGELCGIDEANIRKYELGRQNPRCETLEKIALALNVPVASFFKP